MGSSKYEKVQNILQVIPVICLVLAIVYRVRSWIEATNMWGYQYALLEKIAEPLVVLFLLFFTVTIFLLQKKIIKCL